MFSPHIFRANDIRGIWKKDFNMSFTKELSYALALLSKNKNIRKPRFLVGYDARLSSPSIAKNLTQNLRKQGICVSLIGLAPSPLCCFLLQKYRFTACIVVTASHNPSEFNGFKIFFNKKYKLLDPISNLKRLLGSKENLGKNYFNTSLYKGYGNLIKIDKQKAYMNSLKKEFSFLKKTSFVVDTGHGALGPLADKAFKSLGLKAKILFKKPDGNFPFHHPDPTIEKNLKALKQELKKSPYAFGLAFDGDGDRLVLVSAEGRTLLGDELGFLLVKSLKKRPALVLADVKCSDWFFKQKEKGLKIKMVPSGHGLIRAEMEKSKASLAIEFSGHIFFNDKKDRGWDDALYASLRWIQYYQSEKKKLQDLLSTPSTATTQEIRLLKSEQEILEALKKIKLYLLSRKESFKSLDGIRLSRKKAWCLFRSSKTQSILSMRFEAENQKILQALKKEFSEILGFKIS